MFQQNEITVKDGSLSIVYTEDSTAVRGRQTILGMAECCFQQVSCKPSTHHYILMSLPQLTPTNCLLQITRFHSHVLRQMVRRQTYSCIASFEEVNPRFSVITRCLLTDLSLNKTSTSLNQLISVRKIIKQ